MDEEQLFLDLAERLRVAHLRVAALKAPDDEKLSVSRHLGVITATSKHDLKRAAKRLDAFLAELENRFPSDPSGS